MFQSLSDLARELKNAVDARDLDQLEKLAECVQASDEPTTLPFSTAVEFNPELVQVDSLALESDVASGFANFISRWRRRLVYEFDQRNGIRHPVVVSEGDSWFQYPVVLDDVIDHLVDRHEFQVFSLGHSGDVLEEMVQEREYFEAIESEEADVFLISAGGNDMLGGGRLREFVREFRANTPLRELLNTTQWNSFLDHIEGLYRTEFDDLLSRFSGLQILCHGYDYALPRTNGTWLGKPLTDRGFPRSAQAGMVAILIDDFNTRLSEITGDFGQRVHHVDCRNSVGGAASWHDELHPKNAGFGRVANLFANKIAEVTLDSGTGTGAEALAPAEGARSAQRAKSSSQCKPEQEIQSPIEQLFKRKTSRQISNPALGDMNRSSSEAVSTEALVKNSFRDTQDILMKQSTPRIPMQAFPRSERHDCAAATTAESPASANSDAVRISRNVRSIITQLQHDSRDANADDPKARIVESSPERDQELRRRPLCESREVWQAHLRNDIENLRSYNEYCAIKEQFDKEEDGDRMEMRKSLVPVPSISLQERILGESDLFQLNFLSRGVRAARAVGRITAFSQFDISLGSGTGFLVAPGILLTNHHVIESASIARHSHILFEYEYDERNHLKTTEQFELSDEVFVTSKSHDFTFVSVRPIGSLGNSLDTYGQLQLIRQSGKAVKGEPISIIQHADGLPKQLAIRNSRVVGRARQFIYYTTDTNPGSSGSPVTNDQWFPVALHHRSIPHYFETCTYVANRGIRISSIYDELDRLAALGSADAGTVVRLIETSPTERALSSIRVHSRGTDGELERNVEPFHEVPYTDRTGFDRDYLGIHVPFPEIIDPDSVAVPLLSSPHNGPSEFELKYEHFSVVMHRQRRLAMLTAANVDFSRSAKRPEPRPSSDYTRKGLGGLGRNDREKWFEDPRIASEHQIPDRFYNKDRKAFHKGHIVRRDAVAWGETYAELRRANGDTFHVTNCSPQVGHFNSALERGIWGQLENEIGRQAKSERLCILAGPLFSAQDREFHGVDNSSDIVVQIPSIFWKVVVAREGSELRVFAFWLQQNLNDVAFEFSVPGEWRTRQISLAELERKISIIRFDDSLHNADQF